MNNQNPIKYTSRDTIKLNLAKILTYDEDSTFRKSRKDKEDEEEHETPKTVEVPKEARVEEEAQIPEEHDMTDSYPKIYQMN